MSQAQRQHGLRVILAFGLVYLFWGSTYLGISIAVERIPPALMCATRFSIAGLLMLLYCAATGRTVSYPKSQIVHFAIVGNLLLTGGNLTLSYAELYVPTGYSALILASTPLFFLVLDTLLLGDHHISRRGMIGLALGVVGLAVLLWPKLTVPNPLGRKSLWYSVALLGGALSWALGSVLSKKWRAGGSLGATGWQMLFAGGGNFVFALLNRDIPRATWTARGLGAIVYLVIGGSLIGYTSYIWLLQHAPISKVSTYAYVNPIVAVFLGWLILHEAIDRYILIGSAIVVASVVLVTSAKVKKRVATPLPVASAATS